MQDAQRRKAAHAERLRAREVLARAGAHASGIELHAERVALEAAFAGDIGELVAARHVPAIAIERRLHRLQVGERPGRIDIARRHDGAARRLRVVNEARALEGGLGERQPARGRHVMPVPAQHLAEFLRRRLVVEGSQSAHHDIDGGVRMAGEQLRELRPEPVAPAAHRVGDVDQLHSTIVLKLKRREHRER